jgi:hypothetical protein
MTKPANAALAAALVHEHAEGFSLEEIAESMKLSLTPLPGPHRLSSRSGHVRSTTSSRGAGSPARMYARN